MVLFPMDISGRVQPPDTGPFGSSYASLAIVSYLLPFLRKLEVNSVTDA